MYLDIGMGYVFDTKYSARPAYRGMMRLMSERYEATMTPPFLAMVTRLQKQVTMPAAEAAGIIRVTVKTLGERLPAADRRWLAARLPAEAVQGLDLEAAAEKFTLNHFYERVTVRAGVDLPTAVSQVMAVISSLEATLNEPDFAHFQRQLPLQFKRLFGPEPDREIPD